MTINKLMWIAIFSIIPHPLEVSDVLTGIILSGGVDMMIAVILDVDMLSDMEVVVMATPAITLEFVVGLTYAEDLPTDLLAVIIIDIIPAIDTDIFFDGDMEGLAAAMTPVEFTLPVP